MRWFRKSKPAGTQPVLGGVKLMYICPTCGSKADKFPHNCDICRRMLCSSCNKDPWIINDYSFRPHFCPDCFGKLKILIEKWKRGEIALANFGSTTG